MRAFDYAREELERIENQCTTPDELEIQKHITENVLALIEVFADQGHSGVSANYVAVLFDHLVHFRPLTPLTGENDEWNDVGYGKYQNRRCCRVFKNADGRAYDSEYWYKEDENGISYTDKDCRQDIVFPYMPQKPKFLDIPEWSEEELNKMELIRIKDNEEGLLEKKAKEIKNGNKN